MISNNLSDFRARFRMELKDIYPTGEIDSLFRIVISEVTNSGQSFLPVLDGYVLTFDQEQQLSEILERLKKNEPVQYIFKKAWFYDLELEVNEDVLIPRQETEILVHEVLNHSYSKMAATILDIGTGSGCIAIALKKNIPSCVMYALDVSEKALAIASRNASATNTPIYFICNDIFYLNSVDDVKFNIIVSNPPYVRVSEKALMHANVTSYEPALALYVPDFDPLNYYRAIARFASANLSESGLVVVEINENLGEETAGVFRNSGFKNIKILKDLNEKDRILVIQRE